HSFFFLMIPPPPSSTLFPYTTLFRSWRLRGTGGASRKRRPRSGRGAGRARVRHSPPAASSPSARPGLSGQPLPLSALHVRRAARSEEHTSELQSLTNLVCRLLLEKKN